MLHNRAMARLLVTSAAFVLFFLFALEATAQALPNQGVVQFVVSPEVPGPGDTVKIEAQGIGSFLGEANITWRLNSNTALSGVGKRDFTFVAGGLGSHTSVSVTITSASQGTITKTFDFYPSVVNLLWEADTSAPPLFRGKPLYTAGSTITVTALPQVVRGGRTITYNNLSFQWERNGTPLPQQSGLGMNQITFAGNQLLPNETVDVDIVAGGSTVAQGEITIPAVKPQVVLYMRDPLRGMLFDQALQGSVSMNQTEFTIRAVPYYVANSSVANNALTYAWKLNGKEATGPDTARGLLTLRQAGSGAGQASLSVAIQNIDSTKFVQAANAAIAIVFGGGTNSAFSSFFGL